MPAPKKTDKMADEWPSDATEVDVNPEDLFDEPDDTKANQESEEASGAEEPGESQADEDAGSPTAQASETATTGDTDATETPPEPDAKEQEGKAAQETEKPPPATPVVLGTLPDGRRVTSENKTEFFGSTISDEEIRTWITHLGQVSHSQHLAEERQRELERLKAEQEAGAEATEPFTPTRLVEQMAPRIKQAQEQGWFSEAFLEDFPVEAAQLVMVYDQFVEFTQQAAPLLEFVNVGAMTAERSQFKNDILADMATMASESPNVYGELASPDTREALFDFMLEMNPPRSALAGDGRRDALKRHFAAFRADEQAAAVEAARRRVLAQGEDARITSQGGDSGGGGVGAKSPMAGVRKEVADILGDDALNA